jgi:hypothetical protein
VARFVYSAYRLHKPLGFCRFSRPLLRIVTVSQTPLTPIFFPYLSFSHIGHRSHSPSEHRGRREFMPSSVPYETFGGLEQQGRFPPRARPDPARMHTYARHESDQRDPELDMRRQRSHPPPFREHPDYMDHTAESAPKRRRIDNRSSMIQRGPPDQPGPSLRSDDLPDSMGSLDQQTQRTCLRRELTGPSCRSPILILHLFLRPTAPATSTSRSAI